MNKQDVILAVDDTPQSLKLLGMILSREGYQTRLADSGELALESLNSSKPDLILLDINMPDMNGFEVCRRLKADSATADIPVIFISAENETAKQVEGFQYGAIDFVTKPFESEILMMRIRTQLELSRLRRQTAERVAELERTQLELKEKVEQLEKALGQVKRLEGIIPVCMYCKQIRDDKESWHKMERYIMDHTDAEFSHGICPACFEEHFGKA